MIEAEKKRVLGWALYDFANSAFSTTVLAGFFPLFFKQYWSLGTEASQSTLRLGLANSMASVIVALLAPLLGAIADAGGRRRFFLAAFAAEGVLSAGALCLVGPGQWQLAALLFVTATIGWAGANVFYDSLIVEVARPERADFISALGYSLGYLGGGILFAGNVLITLKPTTFGLPDASAAVRISFLSVAIWWALFSLPLFLWVKEPVHRAKKPAREALSAGFLQLKETLLRLRKERAVVTFLLAYWLYIDGVDTVIRMAVDYGLSLGLGRESLITALLITQFVGFPAAIIFGKIAERVGSKPAILSAIGAYVLITLFASRMSVGWHFYALAIGIGLVQGGIQSSSRALYTRLIPAQHSAEFFGFYNMLGKFAAVIGPLLMGLVGLWVDNPRLGIIAILPLFLGGAWLLNKVEVPPLRAPTRAQPWASS